VLKGERTLMLRQEAERAPRSKTDTGSRARAPVVDLPASAQALFEVLRAWRGEVARSHGVPAYVIFHDTVLRDIALARPGDLEALSHINGVGARKLEAYGAAILQCIAEHHAPLIDNAP